ncbi:N-acyl amino acid synthase FeeM domain-containing protein [Pelagibacterium halotolerans]|uniref:N-acyl amino acid synthase FeeM catalytic core domain-containing protein n=1 Tax=Pelagibacterium halotolerans (strain DSM 22347 / JCM 15775 / CGMCC 1.7692 / B2) TaxID=1082931 RepID=G4RGQ9_PELHB|nr:hypothetical protein [Pelagibacterium halotolerans]AEQ52098.1 hypothetical protein KKY_2088 [Pelagibacterium halotolerans B2]QJR18130.1 hypothetical protein HKM20_06580 [Pelagibacterium halotolerans]SDZ83445.1 hypothetical protein SAMN05428936_101160 [Pelagibacterium halotolerans]
MSSVAPVGVVSFSQRLIDFLDRIEYRRLEATQEREEAFNLRYEAYVREGMIPIGFEKRLTDGYDDADNVHVFGVHMDGAMVSTIRVHYASPENPHSPTVDAFPETLKPEIDKGHIVVDPTRFAVHPSMSGLHPELPYITARLGFLASEYYSANLGLASVRVEHQAFYRRLFGMRPLCPPREYHGLKKQLSLMGIDYCAVRESVIARYPFMNATSAELEMLFGSNPVPLHAMTPATLPRVGPANLH